MLSENIKMLRKRHGLSQGELAKILNVHQTAVSQWENKRTRPDPDALQNMAALFDVSVDYLLRDNSRSGNQRTPLQGDAFDEIPFDSIESIHESGYLTPDLYSPEKEYFALQIRGDSMSPDYRSGDTVIFAAQDTCVSGQDCAVIFKNNKSVFRRVRFSNHGIILQPLNPQYEPIILPHSSSEKKKLRIIGVAKELRRKI